MDIKIFLIKLIGTLLVSPVIGYALIQLVEGYQKAKKQKGIKRLLTLSGMGFVVAVLLGWLK